MAQFRIAFFIGVAVIWNSGCGPAPRPPAPTAAVKGTINIDGKPVPAGEIHFGLIGAPTGLLKITEGAYSGNAPVGDNNVEVYIYKEEPNPRYPDNPTKINTVPAKFWGPKSTLKASVKAGGPNEFKFDITSK